MRSPANLSPRNHGYGLCEDHFRYGHLDMLGQCWGNPSGFASSVEEQAPTLTGVPRKALHGQGHGTYQTLILTPPAQCLSTRSSELYRWSVVTLGALAPPSLPSPYGCGYVVLCIIAGGQSLELIARCRPGHARMLVSNALGIGNRAIGMIGRIDPVAENTEWLRIWASDSESVHRNG